MYTDARTVPQGSTIAAQVCVIGAGPAGITVARELAGAGVAVCVLESGGLTPDAQTAALAAGESIGEPYHHLDRARARALGGSSHLWFRKGRGWQGVGGMRARPLDARDFDSHAWVPDSGWPIGVSDLEVYYRRAQELCGLGGTSFAAVAWDERGRRIWAPESEVFETAMFQFAHRDAFRRLGAEMAALGGVRLIANADAIRIEREPASGAVSAVLAGVIEGPRFRVKADAYVLAAGGIDNPRLLLLSAEPGRAAPGDGGGAVGRYFMDHLCSYSAAFRPARPSQFRDGGLYQRHNSRGKYSIGALVLRQQEEEREGLLRAAFTLEAVAEAQMSAAVRSALALHWGSGLQPRPGRSLAHAGRAMSGAGSLLKAAAAHVLGRPRPSLFRLAVCAEQAPNRLSRVTLGERRDVLGRQQAVLDWRLSDLDRRSLRRSQEVLARGLNAADLGPAVRLIGDDAAEPPLLGAYHHMGTTRMGTRPETSVVDADCRVHGTPNLFVAGSSVFPTGGHTNPTLTIIALALRLAEALKRETGAPLKAAAAGDRSPR